MNNTVRLTAIDAMKAKYEKYFNRLVYLVDNHTDRDLKFIHGHVQTQADIIKEQTSQLRFRIVLLTRQAKKEGDIPYTELELIMDELNDTYSDAKSNDEVTFKGDTYIRRFQPVELYPSGKRVKKYWPYWLKLNEKGRIERAWQNEVHNLWPEKFVIHATRKKATGYDVK
ncbi:hypothetical protein [Alteromonas gracilis]|uniref:hypothetical protein n=1 Tax=Alteromonas gracilis TaxID=1479524 RepID=UPI0030D10ABC